MATSMGSVGNRRTAMAVKELSSPTGWCTDGGQGTALLARQ